MWCTADLRRAATAAAAVVLTAGCGSGIGRPDAPGPGTTTSVAPRPAAEPTRAPRPRKPAPPVRLDLATVQAAIRDADTGRIVSSTTLPGGVVLEGSGSYRISDRAVSGESVFVVPGGRPRTTTIRVGGSTWVRIDSSGPGGRPATTDRCWFTYEALRVVVGGSLPVDPLSDLLPPEVAAILEARDADDGPRTSDIQPIAGLFGSGASITLSVDATVAGRVPVEIDLPERPSADATVEITAHGSGLLRAIEAAGVAKPQPEPLDGVVATATLSDFGDPVDISPPEPATVLDADEVDRRALGGCGLA